MSAGLVSLAQIWLHGPDNHRSLLRARSGSWQAIRPTTRCQSRGKGQGTRTEQISTFMVSTRRSGVHVYAINPY